MRRLLAEPTLSVTPVSGRVMLKVVPVHLSYEDCTPDTFALLDDGSERTILLSAAVEALGIQGVPEDHSTLVRDNNSNDTVERSLVPYCLIDLLLFCFTFYIKFKFEMQNV